MCLIFALLAFISLACAQPPDTVWTGRYLYDRIDRIPMAAFQVADGNYVICGYKDDGDMLYNSSFAMKLDQNGELLWDHHYVFEEDGRGVCMILRGIPTSDGNFVCTGFGRRGEELDGAYIMKFDLNGDTLWTRIYGAAASKCYKVIELSNGDLVVGQNDVIWISPFEVEVVLSASSFSADGDLLWHRQYHRPDSFPQLMDDPVHVTPFGEDHILLTREIRNSGISSVWLLEIDENGDSLRSTTLSCQPDDDGTGFHLVEAIGTTDGGVLLDGRCGEQHYTAKLNNEYELEWERLFESQLLSAPFYGLEPLPDGGACFGTETIILEPFSYSTVFGRISAVGDTVWTRTFSTPARLHRGGPIGRTEDGGYICALTVGDPTLPDNHLFVALFEPDTHVVSSAETIPEIPTRLDLQAYPNPFNPTTTISFDLNHPGIVKLNVFNVMGRQVSTLIEDNMSVGHHEIVFDGRELASGIYFARLTAGAFVQSKKMVLLK